MLDFGSMVLDLCVKVMKIVVHSFFDLIILEVWHTSKILMLNFGIMVLDLCVKMMKIVAMHPFFGPRFWKYGILLQNTNVRLHCHLYVLSYFNTNKQVYLCLSLHIICYGLSI